jgi:DNA polymerase-3 subunit delta
MQIKGAGAIEAFVKSPGDKVEAALIYGRDPGLVRERSKRLEAAVLGPDADDFQRIELSEAEIREAPGALYAEAASIAMLGGRKFIRLRITSDLAAAALKTYLDEREAGGARPDAFVVIEAGDLRPTQGLRKAAEGSPLVAAIACYPDDEESLSDLIDQAVRSAGLRIAPEAKGALIDRLGADRGVSRQEIDKLLTYCGAGIERGREIQVEDVLALVGDTGAAELDRLIDAVFSGNLAETARLSARLELAGVSPIRIVRATANHLSRMASLAESGGPRGGFSYRDRALARHLGRWDARRVGRAQSLILEAEIECKSTGRPAAAICERTLLSLARAASTASPG